MFDNVAELENVKRDLCETTGYHNDPQLYRKLGAKIPQSDPADGAAGYRQDPAGEGRCRRSRCTFFSISGSEFIEMFVGVGASGMRDMFESAKQEAPAIIFIDEIDSVGRAHGTGLGCGVFGRA